MGRPTHELAIVLAVPTRLRRAAVLLLAPAIALTLTACGSSDAAKGFDAVGVSGDFGQAPKFDFKKDMTADDAETKTLITGDGATLADGDQVLVNFAVGDATTQKTPLTTYGADSGAVGFQIGQAAPSQPQVLGDVFIPELLKYIKSGVKVGSRIAVAGQTEKVFPDLWSTLPQLKVDIGNADGTVLVMDVVGVAKAPEGATQKSPAWAPKIVEKKGKPASLNFAGTPKLGNKLQVATLTKGTGPAVVAGQSAAVQYLGQVYKGAKPFDESYSTDRFFFAATGTKYDPNKAMTGSVIKGWMQGLVGVTVGSRILIGIPPALGYGKSGQPPTIPGNSTLYFVVDVLGAA